MLVRHGYLLLLPHTVFQRQLGQLVLLPSSHFLLQLLLLTC
jgi:hypothetical protein